MESITYTYCAAGTGRDLHGVSEEELRDLRETLGWLKAAERSFEFRDNPADAVYDSL